MQLVLASNNAGKLAELQAMLAGLPITLVRQSELGVGEAEEPHHTFVENALAKARHAARISGLPALADDAGLCIDAWGGLPGVDTALFSQQRYGIPRGQDEGGNDNNASAILRAMEGETNRSAAMVSVLVALRHADDPEPLIAIGRVAGQLTTERIGTGGFGVDPIFYLPEHEQTFAQMPAALKNQLSHRGRAVAQLRQLIAANWLANQTPA
ncbi:MAG: RdgB/HAM1 family non-canonical purine NTP pyrophosphatase [Brachymonas sp.]|jgi:XTP/dITP diphosphohydrolase